MTDDPVDNQIQESAPQPTTPGKVPDEVREEVASKLGIDPAEVDRFMNLKKFELQTQRKAEEVAEQKRLLEAGGYAYQGEELPEPAGDQEITFTEKEKRALVGVFNEYMAPFLQQQAYNHESEVQNTYKTFLQEHSEEFTPQEITDKMGEEQLWPSSQASVAEWNRRLSQALTLLRAEKMNPDLISQEAVEKYKQELAKEGVTVEEYVPTGRTGSAGAAQGEPKSFWERMNRVVNELG